MERMISYGKLSKKEKRKIDAQKRVTWGFSPVTRKKENGKKYNRKKAEKRDSDIPASLPFRFRETAAVRYYSSSKSAHLWASLPFWPCFAPVNVLRAPWTACCGR
jgi:hypothetical protein